MTSKVETVIECSCVSIGEGPHWDERTQTLLYVDIVDGSVHRWSPETGVDEKHTFDTFCSLVVPCRKGGYLVSVGKSVCHFDWQTKKTTVLQTVDEGLDTRINDGKCDASGRLWFGTMTMRNAQGTRALYKGSLYSLEIDGAVRKHKECVTVSNGIAWTADNSTMFYSDSHPRQVYAYDFDINSGTIRPPKKPEPPKMIVETMQFNPSVCTCGDHGCQPQYRMEKRVLWTNKEVCNAKQRLKVNDRERKDEHRENKFRKSITKQDRKTGSVTESKQIVLKKEVDQEHRYIEGDEGKQIGLKEEIGKKYCLKEGDASKQIGLKEKTDQKCWFREGDGNKFIRAESFQEGMSGDVEVRGGYKGNDGVNIKESVNVHGCDDDEDTKEECDFKNELGCSVSMDDVCIDEEARNTNYIKKNNSNGRSDGDNSEGRNSAGVYGEKIAGNDSESAYSNDCKGDGKGSKEDQIEKDHTTGERDRTGDSGSAEDDAEYCSENITLINDSDEIAESCSRESEDGSLEDVEIAPAFGIMTIYCNSELHSWRSFKGENAWK